MNHMNVYLCSVIPDYEFVLEIDEIKNFTRKKLSHFLLFF